MNLIRFLGSMDDGIMQNWCWKEEEHLFPVFFFRQ